MHMLSRRVLYNYMTKNKVQAEKFILPYASAVQYNLTSSNNKPNDVPIRHYACSTNKGKQNLLQYPVHPLKDVMDKFMKSSEPFLNAEELKVSKRETELFLTCEGPKLQALLEKCASKERNWLANRWLKTAYMQYRDPVVIYSSPGMVFPKVCFQDDDEYLTYTSKVLFCILKYKELVDTDKIPIIKMGKNELDNSQFSKVLGTCRIPILDEDDVEYNPNSKHVAVIYKNHFYKLFVYSKKDKPLSPRLIFNELKKIVAAEKSDGIPFGILSSDRRDNWANAHNALLAVKGNKEALDEIQKSLITVSLDGEVCVDPPKTDKVVMGELLIHGCKDYSGNRWYDKTIQLIINRNGFHGFCYEHSPAEGQPIALMSDYIIKNLDDEKLQEGAEIEEAIKAQKINLKSSPEVDKHIKTAKANLYKLIDDFELNVLHFEEYGKGFLKAQKLSPDSYIQMALQYAFYKLHKTPGAGYETAHHRLFYEGRTETIRSCSNESIAFAKAMYEPNPDELRADLLRKAVDSHRKYTTMALQGQGVDRHLLGLKLMAIENKLPIPEFYSQMAFQRSTHFRVSTSQVASVNEAFMCYGPMYADGYACCYNPRENDMILACSAWKSNEETSAARFAASLKEALIEMSGVICRTAQNPKSKM